MDPIWHGTKSELPFLNSVKMKMSILIGVTHMNVGIINSLFNHRYFKDHLSIKYEFIPQMIFLNSLFGYLCLLIVGKWASGEWLGVRVEGYHCQVPILHHDLIVSSLILFGTFCFSILDVSIGGMALDHKIISSRKLYSRPVRTS